MTDISRTRGSYESPNSPMVEASAKAAAAVVDDQVYYRSVTGGDIKIFRYGDVPAVEFGFGTQTAHSTDEYTTK